MKNQLDTVSETIGYCILYADRIEAIWRRTLKSARQARWRAGKADAHPPEASTGASTEASTTAQEGKRNLPPIPLIKKKEEALGGEGKANGDFAEPSRVRHDQQAPRMHTPNSSRCST